MSDGHFEAKKHAYRQTQDGIVVSFVVHPSDMSEAIAMAPLGTRFMVAFAEIGDDEKPIEDSRGGATPAVITVPRPQANEAGISKPKRQFSDLPLSAQCAMRCEDLLFAQWFYQKTRYPLSEDIATDMRRFLRVGSRAELDREPIEAGERWRNLEAEFQNWLTDEKYAGARR